MKTFKEFLEEALAASLVKAAARATMRNKMLRSGSASSLPRTDAPKKISSGNIVYHGTTRPASQSINRSGWRTDVNVSRQMSGAGVYVTPQRNAAQSYANKRSNQRGEEPSVRTFRIPSNIYKKAKENRQRSGNWNFNKGGLRFNVLQMSPQAANRYDITNKPSSNLFRIEGPNKKELVQRVRTALGKPQNREVLKREIDATRLKRQKSPQSLQPRSTPPKVLDQYKKEKLR